MSEKDFIGLMLICDVQNRSYRFCIKQKAVCNQNSIKKALLSAAGFVDEKYTSHRQNLAFTEYLKYDEFGLALDSLLELVDETEDKFTIEFFMYLMKAAKLMKFSKEVERINYHIDELQD